MLRFYQTKIANGKHYWAKKPLKNSDAELNNIVILKLVETKSDSKHLIGYLNEILRPLLLILPKMDGYAFLKRKVKN